MPKSKKPRKAYRPKPVITLVDPQILLRPKDQSDVRVLTASLHSCIETMLRGSEPGRSEWDAIVDAANVIETLAQTGKLERTEVKPALDASYIALVNIRTRFKQTGSMRGTAEDIAALRQVVDLYDQCLKLFTAMEMAIAIHKTHDRLLAAQRSGRYAKVTT